MYTQSFLLGFLTHAGLLMGTTLQVAYLLSRGMAGMSTIPMATVFFVSSLIASGFALFGIDKELVDNEFTHSIIAIVGSSILLFEAYKSYKRSQKDHKHCECCEDNKIYSTLFAISLVWLNPHIYTDIIAIYSLKTTFTNISFVSFYIGFNLIAFIWFYGAAMFSKSAKRFIKSNNHRYMHLLSSIILVATVGMLLIGTFVIEHSH